MTTLFSFLFFWVFLASSFSQFAGLQENAKESMFGAAEWSERLFPIWNTVHAKARVLKPGSREGR